MHANPVSESFARGESDGSVSFRPVQGFTVATLTNGVVAVSVVPALGAKLLSLAHVWGREWMWHPPGTLKLFTNDYGDSFSQGTIVGADECFPTIAPCTVQGRELPRHGEVWSQPWNLDEAACARGTIVTHHRLRRAPFTLIREVSTQGPEVRLRYRVQNHSADREPFLWAFHPLMTVLEGDTLIYPRVVTEVRVGASSFPGVRGGDVWTWPQPLPALDLSRFTLESDRASVKCFARAQSDTSVFLRAANGECLEFGWSALEMPFIGLWLSRGAWNGYHHVAIEPTNADCDSLAEALTRPDPTLFVEGGSVREWSVRLRITPARVPEAKMREARG